MTLPVMEGSDPRRFGCRCPTSQIWTLTRAFSFSFAGVDAHEDPDQGKISQPLVERVLAAGTGKNGNLTKKDLSRLLGERRVESKKNNPKFSLAFVHRMFGSSKCVLVLFPFPFPFSHDG